jgi:hypothetical protein
MDPLLAVSPSAGDQGETRPSLVQKSPLSFLATTRGRSQAKPSLRWQRPGPSCFVTLSWQDVNLGLGHGKATDITMRLLIVVGAGWWVGRVHRMAASAITLGGKGNERCRLQGHLCDRGLRVAARLLGLDPLGLGMPRSW